MMYVKESRQAAVNTCEEKGSRTCVSSEQKCNGAIRRKFSCGGNKICCEGSGVKQATVKTCEKKASRTCVSSKRECNGVIKKKFTCDGTKICCAQRPTTVAPPRKLASAVKPKPQDSEGQEGHKGRKPTVAPKAGTKRPPKCPSPKQACKVLKGKCQLQTLTCNGKWYLGKKYCKNYPTCACCAPNTKPCPQTKKCTKKGGKCQNKTDPCSGPTSKGCKGKNCVCCTTAKPPTAVSTTTKAPTTTTWPPTTTSPPTTPPISISPPITTTAPPTTTTTTPPTTTSPPTTPPITTTAPPTTPTPPPTTPTPPPTTPTPPPATTAAPPTATTNAPTTATGPNPGGR
ncbi:salivary glue protein Sgs-3-like isoform X4 [Macrobrachium rosenbergii]|uniref:salivary glue protein Sgs-3-like isoform X4 n=1 Tax=Macrobrachium rosenbergii TaxID=79674 RepID=UPI0034D6ADD5